MELLSEQGKDLLESLKAATGDPIGTAKAWYARQTSSPLNVAIGAALNGDWETAKQQAHQWAGTVSKQDVEDAEMRYGVDAAGGGMVGATAWHGSPHLFDKFKNEAIGTGEGAQAYGMGHYLGEARGTGEEYARKLSARKVDNPQTPVERALDDINYFNGNHDAALAAWKANARDFPDKPAGIAAQEKLNAWNNGDVQKEISGNLYKTDIPDAHIDKMLDWDKPLSEQSQFVQDILRPQLTQDVIDSVRARGQGGLAKRLENDPSGSAIYSAITGHDNPSSKLASKALHEAGIPGIKYLDGSSRTAGEGTRNFVMFNPDDIRILEHNGQPTGQVPWDIPTEVKK